MESSQTVQRRAVWNKGKLVGQKTPFKLKEIWAIRIRLQSYGKLVQSRLMSRRAEATRRLVLWP